MLDLDDAEPLSDVCVRRGCSRERAPGSRVCPACVVDCTRCAAELAPGEASACDMCERRAPLGPRRRRTRTHAEPCNDVGCEYRQEWRR